ncbi:hypothetical protein [Pseudomonas aeruginosa]|uniref:hypothetical protein n=1 Tax=Pseudomonas aeruginosa TaxID=287 RepID=UPI0017C99A5C|nr:hypothetical protein [Pseudomonas aeruginosa]MDA3228812.1 hypothetical protein [Pseudomonas aeruginosa]
MEKMKTLFRNASIATVGLAVANVSFAESLLDETTKGFWRKPALMAGPWPSW